MKDNIKDDMKVNSWIDKKDIAEKWVNTFKPYERFGGDINVKVDLSNYATKADLKNATGIDTSKLAAKSDLVSLKTEVDKIGVDKLKTVPDDLSNLKSKVDKLDIRKLETALVDLSKLSNVVKNDVAKRLNIILR